MTINNKDIKEAWRQWTAKKDWDYFVSLAFNPQPFGRYWSVQDAARDLHEWHARNDRLMLGGRWHNKPHKRTQFYGFVEHVDSNIHWHLMVKLRSDKHEIFETEAGDVWKKLIPSGSNKIKHAQADEDANKTFSRYCGKAIYINDPAENIQFSQS
ncbi:hypothetical protein A9Q83_01410 [Alphaproteobacteria bacterium 46_93_T64]|nr:hypothetical protein A9Q83_01410 [Alphaproteobacteria bacterium 46_93_T64]